MPPPIPLALFGNLSPLELVLVGVVALMIWGKDLPQVAMRGAAHLVKLRRQVAKMWREAGLEEELRKVKRDIERETRLDDPPRVTPPPSWRPNVRTQIPEELTGKASGSDAAASGSAAGTDAAGASAASDDDGPLDPLAPGRTSGPDEPPPAPPPESPEEPDEPAGERERRAPAVAAAEPPGAASPDASGEPGASDDAPLERDAETEPGAPAERDAKESA